MKKLFILALATLCAFMGCNKENSSDGHSKGGVVRFSTHLNDYAVKSSLAENEQIGVFAGAPISRLNVPGTVNSSKGVDFASGSEILWQAGQTEATTFAAYHPYNANCDAEPADPFKFTFSVPSDQSSAANYAAADLLTALAANVAVPADPATADPITLTFGHQGVKFVVNITKNNSSEVEAVEILDTNLSGTVDLETQTVGSLTTPGTILAFRPDPSSDAFEAIILPAEDIAPKIRITVTGGTTYTYSLNAPMTFAAGKQYTASIDITSQQISSNQASFVVGDITDWEVVSDPLSYDADPLSDDSDPLPDDPDPEVNNPGPPQGRVPGMEHGWDLDF